jgi:hypothetical protein
MASDMMYRILDSIPWFEVISLSDIDSYCTQTHAFTPTHDAEKLLFTHEFTK